MSKWISIDAHAFQQAFKRVSFAVAKEGNPKFTFTAICVRVSPQDIYLMGSNSHRASLGKVDINAPGILTRQVLITPNSLAQINRMFDKSFKLYFGKNAVVAKDSDNTLFMRIVSGNFPDIKKYIPTYQNKLVVDADDFLAQVRKAALAVSKTSTLKMSLSKDLLRLASQSRRPRKSAMIDWKIQYSGKSIEFAVNCSYLQDVLKVADSSGITIHFGEDNEPLLFTQPNFQYMMVPQEI
jgi:DNA polymerase-3 subunit beta